MLRLRFHQRAIPLPAAAAALCMLLSIAIAQAQQADPQSTNYVIPADSQDAGGGENAVSNNYVLDDTIGEATIGTSVSTHYELDAGFRQAVATFISLRCTTNVGLPAITLNGQSTGSGTCVVTTDAEAGYSLSWQVVTGSGGTNTGYMISQFEDTIAPFTPNTANTPDDWSILPSRSEWGGRLRSSSTDTAVEWGTDGSSDKWLDVGTNSARTIVTRSSPTDPSGSNEILQFRVGVGAAKNQPSGNYSATIVMTALSL